MFKLAGNLVRDTVTGFTGIATGRAEYMYGCNRIQVEPKELKDGAPIESCWFDEQRIEVVKADTPKVSKDSRAMSGGPQNDPMRNNARS